MRNFSAYLAMPDEPTAKDWVPPIVQRLISAFPYSLILIVIAIVAKLGGHDLIDIVRNAPKPG